MKNKILDTKKKNDVLVILKQKKINSFAVYRLLVHNHIILIYIPVIIYFFLFAEYLQNQSLLPRKSTSQRQMCVFAPTDKRFALQHIFQSQAFNGQSVCKFEYDCRIGIKFSLRDVE